MFVVLLEILVVLLVMFVRLDKDLGTVSVSIFAILASKTLTLVFKDTISFSFCKLLTSFAVVLVVLLFKLKVLFDISFFKLTIVVLLITLI